MIDWNRVAELRGEVGAEDFGEVVELFLEEVDGMIAKITSDTSRASLEQDMHFLKGSALSLGFQEFSAMCQEGERTAAAGSADQVDISAIAAKYEASKIEFTSQLDSRFAAA